MNDQVSTQEQRPILSAEEQRYLLAIVFECALHGQKELIETMELIPEIQETKGREKIFSLFKELSKENILITYSVFKEKIGNKYVDPEFYMACAEHHYLDRYKMLAYLNKYFGSQWKIGEIPVEVKILELELEKEEEREKEKQKKIEDKQQKPKTYTLKNGQELSEAVCEYYKGTGMDLDIFDSEQEAIFYSWLSGILTTGKRVECFKNIFEHGKYEITINKEYAINGSSYRVDFEIKNPSGKRIIIELDSFKWHTKNKELFTKHCLKHNAITMLCDIPIFHLTWQEVTQKPKETINSLIAFLDRR